MTQPISGDYAPELSPAGSMIVFTRADAMGQAVWLMRVDGTQLRQLTTLPSDALDPTWSPDGSQVAFAHRLSHETAFVHHIINVDGSGLRRLNTPIDSAGGAQWLVAGWGMAGDLCRRTWGTQYLSDCNGWEQISFGG